MQVYELGVEERCLGALQLLDQLADVRVKIARWVCAACMHVCWGRGVKGGVVLLWWQQLLSWN